MRILIAEDDPLLADGLTRSMRGGEHAVDCVNDGAAADHALSTQTYDLEIIDLGLPRMDGFEFTRAVRASQQWRHIPIIIISSYVDEPHRATARAIGVDEYLGKPYEASELLAHVRALLSRALRASA